VDLNKSCCEYTQGLIDSDNVKTRKPSYRWQTRTTREPAKNCSNSTCLQRCRWQYWPNSNFGRICYRFRDIDA